MQNAKRKPNWTLCVKDGERWRNIGAAWETEKGNLYVRLDAGCTLTGTAMFFPYREKPPIAGGGSGGSGPSRPPQRPPTQQVELDYMERKRAARSSNHASIPPTDDVGPDLDAPDDPRWL